MTATSEKLTSEQVLDTIARMTKAQRKRLHRIEAEGWSSAMETATWDEEKILHDAAPKGLGLVDKWPRKLTPLGEKVVAEIRRQAKQRRRIENLNGIAPDGVKATVWKDALHDWILVLRYSGRKFGTPYKKRADAVSAVEALARKIEPFRAYGLEDLRMSRDSESTRYFPLRVRIQRGRGIGVLTVDGIRIKVGLGEAVDPAILAGLPPGKIHASGDEIEFVPEDHSPDTWKALLAHPVAEQD